MCSPWAGQEGGEKTWQACAVSLLGAWHVQQQTADAVVGAQTKERGDERRVGESGRDELPRIRSAGQRGCAGEPPLPLRSEICEGTHT